MPGRSRTPKSKLNNSFIEHILKQTPNRNVQSNPYLPRVISITVVVSIQIIQSLTQLSNPTSEALTFQSYSRLQHFSLPPKKVAKACECPFKHSQFHYTIKRMQRRFQTGNSSTAKQNSPPPPTKKKTPQDIVSRLGH